MKKIISYALLFVLAFILGMMFMMGLTTGDWVTPLCERLGTCI